MPSLETPPNAAPPSQTVKVRTGRFGELEEHELIHLLDSLDDERSKARFRESIYISIIIYLAIGWFLFYGPRVLFHQPRLISPAQVLKERELTRLDDPKNLSHLAPSAPKPQPAQPVVDKKMLKQLQAMRRAAPPTPAAPAPTPLPQVTQPAPTQQATPLPPSPTPAPTQQPAQQALVEAPKPAPTRPNFGNPNQSAGDAIRQAAQNASRGTGGGDYGSAPSGSHAGMGTGAEILSDTQGVDFGPYIRRILSDIKRNWIPLIPEEARPPLNKQGETLIRFTILPDGRIAAMNLDGSSQDQSIDKACWGAITGEGQFPALPASFHGPNLELRIDFLTNKPLP
ncbi:TonB C-terminal domain-containing protein [Granulicella sp. S190]|uniref:TonB C-terminal domain-containing protein n=1 Tax=Granulicella sp. S190 TaxID=1747226 RepID=UPI00131CD531|nr:TonB C-terminal domain-containing protein [Granulicella sp. S190]